MQYPVPARIASCSRQFPSPFRRAEQIEELLIQAVDLGRKLRSFDFADGRPAVVQKPIDGPVSGSRTQGRATGSALPLGRGYDEDVALSEISGRRGNGKLSAVVKVPTGH